jgi:hypothetical protein
MEPEDVARERIVDINTAAGERVYMLMLPQRPTLPAVRVQLVGGFRGQHLRGPLNRYVTRVQVDSYAAASSGADAYADVQSLASAIRGDGLGPSASGLAGWIGEMGSPGIRVMNVEIDHDGTPDFEGGELRLVRIRQDYLVHWSYV